MRFRARLRARCWRFPTRRIPSPGCLRWGCSPRDRKIRFALRRAGNGIVRILAEHKLPLSISQIMADALLQYKGSEAEKKFTAAESFRRMSRRSSASAWSSTCAMRGAIAYDVVNAVLASGADNVPDAIMRAEAVARVRGSEDFEAISVAFKRMKNILRQAAESKKTDRERLPEPR